MKKMVMVMIGMAILVMFGFSGNGYAAEKPGTAAEAEAMVKKAIAFAKAKGNDAALAEISNPKGKFVDRDLYVTVYDMNGKCMAHGANPKMIGKDLIGLKDPDGKEFFKERIEIAKTAGKGWQDYKFSNPLTKKIEPKRAYFERNGDLVFACGFYK
jgi:signal transduction histidine kinase